MYFCRNHYKYQELHNIFLVGIALFINGLTYGQSETNLWVFGIGVNAIDYYPSNAPNTGNDGGFLNQLFNTKNHWNIGSPNFSYKIFRK